MSMKKQYLMHQIIILNKLLKHLQDSRSESQFCIHIIIQIKQYFIIVIEFQKIIYRFKI
jgi:hypothetical protein